MRIQAPNLVLATIDRIAKKYGIDGSSVTTYALNSGPTYNRIKKEAERDAKRLRRLLAFEEIRDMEISNGTFGRWRSSRRTTK